MHNEVFTLKNDIIADATECVSENCRVYRFCKRIRHVCETQMSPIMTNPKMTKVTRTSILIPEKDLVTRNAHENSNINYLEVMIIVIFKILKIQNKSIVNVKMFSTDRKILSQGIFILNMKTLTLAVEKLLTRLKFSKNRLNSKVKAIG